MKVSVMEFHDVLAKYFRVRGNVASGKVDKPRNRGRWALAHSMADMGFQFGVEIGTHQGNSAEMWCSVNPQLKLTCVDPYGEFRKRHRCVEQDAAYQSACERLSQFGVNMIRKTSLSAVDEFKDGSLDFVHIDGEHLFDAVITDLVAWVPKVRKGGLVLLHDYFTLRWQGVTQAVNAYVCAHSIDKWYVTQDVSPTVFWEKT